MTALAASALAATPGVSDPSGASTQSRINAEEALQQAKAGGFLRTSTRPTPNPRTKYARLHEHSP